LQQLDSDNDSAFTIGADLYVLIVKRDDSALNIGSAGDNGNRHQADKRDDG
jgi:hypothetical protein